MDTGRSTKAAVQSLKTLVGPENIWVRTLPASSEVCCSVLQCVAVFCSVLQCVACAPLERSVNP